MPVAFRLERQGREQASLPERDGSGGKIEFGLYLRDSFELNVERRSEARNFVRHVLLKAISRPTLRVSMIDSGFCRHGASNSFDW